MARLSSSDLSITASATGNNIRVVAVFDIHMLRTAAAAIKPNTSLRLLFPPNKLTMPRATRLCAPLFSMAVDRMKPPISSSTSGEP